MSEEPARSSARSWRPAPWLSGYRGAWFKYDLVGALTVWALLIPESLAYATIAGVSPVVGLYAAVPALIIYALLGSSRHLVISPMSATAALSGSVAALYGDGTPEGVLRVTLVLAVAAGVMGVVAGVLRLGFLSAFVSEPVLKGFIVGLALTIALGQVPRLLDVKAPPDGTGFFPSIWQIVTELDTVQVPSMVVGLVALACLVLIRRFLLGVPGPLVVVLAGILASRLFALEELGVPLVGKIPSGLPAPALPGGSLEEYLELAGPAAGVLLIGFVEGLAAAKTYAARFHYRLDHNRELTALGACNVGAGLFGGMVVNGSLSKTAVNGTSGARTQASNVMVAALTVLTLLFFTGPFGDLPEPVLAAIVIAVVGELVNIGSLRRLYRVWSAQLGHVYRVAARADFVAAVAALAGVLALGTLRGLLFGVAISLLLLLLRASRPHLAPLVFREGAWVDSHRVPDAEPSPDGVVVMRVEAQLFFANAEYVADAVRDQCGPGVHAIVLDASTVPAIDVTAADLLAELQEELQGDGVELLFAEGPSQVWEVIDAAGHNALLANVYPSVEDAIAAAEGTPDS